jgi:hypothetical protein
LSDTNDDKRKRGRPRGFKLSQESKDAISESKMGQSHTQETKDKISRSLIIYFKRKNPLSDEIENIYCRLNDDGVYGWMENVREELNELDDVRTSKSMRNTRKMELTCGNNIEYFGHTLTPEVILIFKEFCEIHGLNPNDVFDFLL